MDAERSGTPMERIRKRELRAARSRTPTRKGRGAAFVRLGSKAGAEGIALMWAIRCNVSRRGSAPHAAMSRLVGGAARSGTK
jgi:hypothetical protein